MPLLSPLRTTVDLVARTARGGAGLALTTARTVARPIARRVTGGDRHEAARQAARPPRPAPPARPAPSTPAAPPERVAPLPETAVAPSQPAPAFDEAPDQPEFRPAHVDEPEPEVVHSSADPGAVEGAGANLRVEEPWSGYGKMTAADIVDRVVAADVATLAAVQLFEATHRKRTTVLSAVERTLSAAGS